nr:immunoglobulin light chain junction region [Macaca mulatta]MOY14416.1 immunoglobulin light chain junction region [Macaca mulatta]
CQQYHGLITF